MLTRALLTAGLAMASLPAFAQEVNVYTYREPALIKPLFDAFTADTGIKVNVVFAKDGLEDRIAAEGIASPADLLLTVDIGRLEKAVEKGFAEPVQSEVLAANIPAQYRDGENRWFGVSARARVVYASTDRFKGDTLTYEEIADPKFRGKICIRDGQHVYNNALFADVLAKSGREKTQTWLAGLRDNLARKPSGGDRDVAKDIAAGICDLGLANTYYVGLMQNGPDEQKAWAKAIKVIMPTFADGSGTHVNISGFVVVKTAPNKANAIKLGEWLSAEKAQEIYASANFEYPVKAGVPINETVKSFGPLKPDTTPLSEIAKLRREASELVEEVEFNDGPAAKPGDAG
jgi:iron(III) transport system substrate-binding protein